MEPNGHIITVSIDGQQMRFEVLKVVPGEPTTSLEIRSQSIAYYGNYEGALYRTTTHEIVGMLGIYKANYMGEWTLYHASFTKGGEWRESMRLVDVLR